MPDCVEGYPRGLTDGFSLLQTLEDQLQDLIHYLAPGGLWPKTAADLARYKEPKPITGELTRLIENSGIFGGMRHLRLDMSLFTAPRTQLIIGL